MMLQHDRIITISVANGRKSGNWKPQKLSVKDLWERLETPARGRETIAEYFSMTKDEMDRLKDVGGFFGGSLNGKRRKAAAVVSRDLITLDFDAITKDGLPAFMENIESLQAAAAVYSTRKHTPEKPRMRVLIPLDRTVSPDEYEAIARRAADRINPGLQWIDPTTFDTNRFMYWPSCCNDGEYIFRFWDAALLRAGDALGTYTDWKDCSEWPAVPGEKKQITRDIRKQGNPEEKPGLVGAFCRIYDIHSAIETFLGDEYVQAGNDPNRYTYTHGSTTGGAVVYDDGRFLYSNHATDPCSGKLVNSFDLVRLHRFGGDDEKAAADTSINELPSYKSMCEYAASLPDVVEEADRKRREEAARDFEEAQENNRKPSIAHFHKLSARGIPTEVLDSRVEDYIIKKYRIMILEGKPYIYENGYYSIDEDGMKIKRLIRECIVPELVTAYRLDRVYKLFLGDERLALGDDQVNSYPETWINFKNGMLDVRTGEMHAHSPEYYSLNQIPHEYRPDLEYKGCTADRFFQGLIPDNEDRDMFLTFSGLCMTRDTSFQKFLVLQGPGGIGKSVACSLITDMIGGKNISSVPLQRLNERFQSVPLMHKLANISTDIPATSMDQTSVIRLLTGEDQIPAEYKGGKSFQFKSYARLLFSANEMPAVLSENPEAYFRRLMVVECKKGQIIPELRTGLKKSIPAFIAECVRRLQGSYILGSEIDSPNSRAAVDMLLLEADSTVAFIRECTSRDALGRIHKPELYDRYCDYCSDQQWRPKSKQRFYRSVQGMGFPSRPSNGKDWFIGMKYKDNYFNQ